MEIRDERYRVLISDIGGKEISLRALVEMYHDTVVNDVKQTCLPLPALFYMQEKGKKTGEYCKIVVRLTALPL